jgi:hypothetical protein
MGIKLMSVVFGLVAVTALFGNPAAMACMMVPPLSFEDLNEFSRILAPGTDWPAVAASTGNLAVNERQLAPDLGYVAQTAQSRFQAAIAAGVAQPVLTCLGADQQAALQVKRAVAGSEDSQFQTLFTAVVGDLSTAATGSAESMVVINPHRSVRSTSASDGGGASSTNTAGVFGVAALNEFAWTGWGSSSKFDALHERAGAMRRT